MGVVTQDSVDPHSAPQHSIVMQLVAVLGLLLAVGQTISQEQGGPPFLCPESNGFFPDPEQCDKYYECVGEIPEEKFCPDGLLFEASNPNNELCDYPTPPSPTPPPAGSTSCASSPPPPRSWAALTAWCSITSTTSVSIPRTVLRIANAGTHALTTPSALRAATQTAPAPRQARGGQESLIIDAILNQK